VSDPDHHPLFTVFTATYNRAHTLARVRESLRSQTFRDFEWLIVDDGSTDDTRRLVDTWIGASEFPVRYLHQPHAGKHVAFNKGVREARGVLFLPLDSDDAAVPQALERFQAHWASIPVEARARFSAVTALCMDDHGRPVGGRFPSDITDSDSLEQYFHYRIGGDKWGFQRTDVLRDFPFPEPPGVSFVSESIVWFAIARRFKTRYVNEHLLRIYHASDAAEPRLSRLTAATAQGRLLFHKAVIEDYLDYATSSPKLILKSLVNYSRYSFTSGIGLRGQVTAMRSVGRKALVLAAVPIGFVFHMRDRWATPAG
jgi:glycosyltransferase involved in cell wall biosynthesis